MLYFVLYIWIIYQFTQEAAINYCIMPNVWINNEKYVSAKYLNIFVGCIICHDDLEFLVFNATFNNISVISWRSDLLVEETVFERWLFYSHSAIVCNVVDKNI